MGTRHLIAVYKDGKHRIAQYGQWDGYPEGAGADVLKFLQDDSAVHMLKEYRLDKCSFYSLEDLDDLDTKRSPQLSRNLGADILTLASKCDGLALVDSIDFAGDSLFCEWAYVIDFDTKVFEVYEGFNTKPAVGRFKDFIPDHDEYQPVTLVRSYSLGNLPTVEEFIKDCNPSEPEELVPGWNVDLHVSY